jgi:uncharacterized protein with GYD domain
MPGRIKKDRSAAAETITYFFLMTHNEKGAQQSPREKQQAIAEVTKAVIDEKGFCILYLAKGSAYDYVSVMTGLSPAAAVRIANVIESRGTVKTTVLPGLMVARSAPESAGEQGERGPSRRRRTR